MKLKFLTLLLIGVTCMSCSDPLPGTWTIQKYETSTPSKENVSLMNIGTITFHKDGTGEKDIRYTVFENLKEDKSSFKWTKSHNYVTVESIGSEFAKTWIVIQDGSKIQKWQSTDGNNQVQVLELVK
jgi:hypothetical protein